jgi:hypothetical protein
MLASNSLPFVLALSITVKELQQTQNQPHGPLAE